MKLLIVEDQPKTGHYLRQGLTEAGFNTELVADGSTGQQLALTGDYALLILDVMLPGRDGWQILQAVRGAGLDTPVLFLTTRDEMLLRRQGEVLPKSLIASQVWDMNFDSDTNVIEVAIRRLRLKIDDEFPNKLIHTVRGMGYVLEERPA
ncbi:winged helix-turn-helix domain-containing protein [Pseudomonas sp. PMCC200344]|uniref:winged helix-turn-helix domain-containing protein n=1 Tax=Pseudomonas sp. PMCC200344 TaxID=3042028 RepID=UPI0024B35300|nr:winged helix-turn-helix domain-containing protein [Pseudomonas sp. PMCC200344]